MKKSFSGKIISGCILNLSALLFILFLNVGCTSASLKMEPRAENVYKQELPVKFRFENISWNTESGLPNWFSKEYLSRLINNIKARSPELFSDDPKALPLTFYFEHSQKNTTNGGLAFLSAITFFLFPGIVILENDFNIKVRIGEPFCYEEKHNVKIRERSYLSLIPFFAFLLPSQSDNFCDEFVSIKEGAVDSGELQNVFLNMIYRLNADKLRQIYDDKYGEEVQLLE